MMLSLRTILRALHLKQEEIMPRKPNKPDPVGKVRIMLERGVWPETVSCFWHHGCQVRPYAMMIVVSKTDDYNVIECGACGKKGRYPVGGSCLVTCDEDVGPR
jgi:hypothetical protein